MNDFEKYEFDRLGYIVIPDFLNDDEVKQSLGGRQCRGRRRGRSSGSPAGQDQRL